MSRFWRHFISNGLGGRRCSKLGIQGHGVPLDPRLTGPLGLPQQQAVEVWKITPGGPSEKAGVREEDLILTLADQPATSVDKVHQLLRHHPEGLPLPLVLLRGSQRLERWVVPNCGKPIV
jgi:S1-C subfamily serine protease